MIASVLVVTILVGTGGGYLVGTSSQRTTTLVSTVTLPAPFANMTAPQCSISVSLPCGVTGGTQGILVIANASLTVPIVDTNNSISGFLSLTLVHTGDFEGGPLNVYLCQLGGGACGEILHTTAAGQTGSYVTPTYGSSALTYGMKYEVEVDSLYHSTTYPGEGEVDEVEVLNFALTAN